MKTYVLMVMVFVASVTVSGSTNWYGGSHTIESADSYGSLNLWNAAELTMTGGSLVSLDLLGSSSAAIQGGSISQGISVWQSGSLVISGGTVGSFIQLADNGFAEFRGGDFYGWMYAKDDSEIHVYGYDFHYNPDGGSRNGGQLSGRWAYGGTFQFDFVDNIETGSTYHDHVVLSQFIPEPATLLLLGVGGMLIRKRDIN